MNNYILTKELDNLPSNRIISEDKLPNYKEFSELDVNNPAAITAVGLTKLPAISNEESDTKTVLMVDKNQQGDLVLEWVTVDEYNSIENNKLISAHVISLRNKLLTDSDWTQMPDVTLANKAAWVTYRQALRDITAQAGYPWNVEWPVKPE